MKNMKALDKILNESSQTNCFAKNYFFAATVFIVAFCIILHAANVDSSFFIGTSSYEIHEARNLSQVIYVSSELFLRSLMHSNWQHALLNMLCFLVVGSYLERKMGSVRLFLSLIVVIIISSWALRMWARFFVGFSGVNFALYAIVIVDYIFVLLDKGRTKQRLIYGGMVVALIYFAMCFSGGTQAISFRWYPYDLLNHGGHAAGFLAGFVIYISYKVLGVFFETKTSQHNKAA